MNKIYFFLLLTIIFLFSEMSIYAQNEVEQKISDDFISNLSTEFESGTFANSFHGFALYDLDKQEYLFEYNADKYFTPASNVKIATLFAATKILDAHLPALAYFERGDSLIFWGTGDPTFLHPYFDNALALKFLEQKSKEKKLFFSYTNYIDDAFGDGWAWEDYKTSFGTEKSGFPIFGNAVFLTATPSCEVLVSPTCFAKYMRENEALKTRTFRFKRDFTTNEFDYNIGNLRYERTREMPFRVNPDLVTQLLSDTLGVAVKRLEYPMPEHTSKLYTFKTEDMLRRMMQRSDNFLAEQTLLMCSAELYGKLNTEKVIKYLKKTYFKRYKYKPRWVDGSGLSRYNLFTPHNFIDMLLSIHKDLGEETAFSILAIGGKVGTIAGRYKYPRGGEPFVFAKTGTLSNNHCLSGFLITKSGRKFCFSFLNNHHRVSTRRIANKMEYILTKIHKLY